MRSYNSNEIGNKSVLIYLSLKHSDAALKFKLILVAVTSMYEAAARKALAA